MKKVTKKLLIAMVITLIMITQSGIVNAAYTVGIKAIRDDSNRVQKITEKVPGTDVDTLGDVTPYSYKADTNTMLWKLLDYTSGIADWNTAIYCLEQGVGFGSSGNSLEELEAERVNYNASEIMEIKQSLGANLSSNLLRQSLFLNRSEEPLTPLLSGIEDETTYNKVLWILDHCYLPKSTDRENQRNKLLTDMLQFVTENQSNTWFNIDLDYVGDSIQEILLTDSDIEAVQQAAIWYYTDFSENENWTNLPAITLKDVAETETSLSQLGRPASREGFIRNEEAKLLYLYFIKSADTNFSLYKTQRELEPTILMPELNSSIVKQGTTTIVGPFKYEVTDNGKTVFDYEAVIKIKQTGNTDFTTNTNYTLLKSDKTTTATISELKGQEFYISLSDVDISSLEITVQAKWDKKIATKWMATETGKEEQDIAIITVENPIISAKIKSSSSFDLALRKFITKINSEEITSRVPSVDSTKLNTIENNNNITTANYTHPKDSMQVRTGDIVTYTIRIYNEGTTSGYAEEIADYIPEGLGYLVQHTTNYNNNWQLPTGVTQSKLTELTTAHDKINLSEFTGITDINEIDVVTSKTKITTNKLRYINGSTNNLIPAYDDANDTLSYKDVEVTCIVLEPDTSSRILKNVAEITSDLDLNGNEIEDRDSEINSVNIDTYPENTNIQDDDDYEKLVLKYFDLALRKFITGVNNTEITDRTPIARQGDEDIVYEHTKEPVSVKNSDLVTFTLRVFNEGKMDGYVEEIKDIIPEGMQYDPTNETNIKYGWKMYKVGSDDIEVEITDPSEANQATILKTNYLSKVASETRNEDNLIKVNDGELQTSENGNYYDLDYRDVKIELKVTEPNSSTKTLVNNAEIIDDSDENGNEIDDKDSTPGNFPEKDEDDNDFDNVILSCFDLALRKFITGVEDLNTYEEITTRIPQVTYKDNKFIYTHPKTPLLVANGNIVTYTIRIYNEGNISGYAEEIIDDIPSGLIFLEDNETNTEYRWKVSADGKTISTDYLSRAVSSTRQEDCLIKAFDSQSEISNTNPDYRDVKIVFKITQEDLPEDRILINTAEISDDCDNNGNEIEDTDSIPGNNENDEDDIDTEKVQVKYFDLSLSKYVSKVILIEDGETSVRETGYNGLEDPEPIVKVELHRKKLDKVIVKFVYTIKITNEGQIPGYATEITDYIPVGLEFVQEDNSQWTIDDEGKIVTNALAKTFLRPGESAEVDITLTWINDSNNLGLKTNVAEISDDYNNYDSPDIDSVPDNEKEGEDDIDEALVMLSVSTGDSAIYFTLTGIILLTITGGIFLIKKFVL